MAFHGVGPARNTRVIAESKAPPFHRNNCRIRFVNASRSILPAAASRTTVSHLSTASFSFFNNPFSLRKTRHVASAVLLFPSTKG
jgi:hypothetical protein